MKAYLVTIKPTKKQFYSESHLRTCLTHAIELYTNRKLEWGDPGIELDCIKRLHLHVMLRSPTNMSMRTMVKQYNNYGSTRIHFQPIKKADIERATAYCHKDKTPKAREWESEEYYFILKCKCYNFFRNVKLKILRSKNKK